MANIAATFVETYYTASKFHNPWKHWTTSFAHLDCGKNTDQ